MNWSAAEIRKRALKKGGPWSTVSFLKSKQVAEKVRDNTVKQLRLQGVKDPEDKAVVELSRIYQGTWSVRVRLPGVQLSSRMPGGPESNKRWSNIAVRALRAAYSDGDLLTSWSPC